MNDGDSIWLVRINTDQQNLRCEEQRSSLLKQKSCTVHARCSFFTVGIGGIAFVMAATQADLGSS